MKPTPQPPPSGGSNLERMQRWFQSVITHPDGAAQGAASEKANQLLPAAAGDLKNILTSSSRLDAQGRIGVYANAYYSRLLECIEEVYPMLRKAVGEEAFGGFSFGYLQQHPSRSYTLNALGCNLPGYLQATRPPREESSIDKADWNDFIIELATLEWAIYEVFDGPGTESEPVLGPEALAMIAPEDWPKRTLVTAPCLHLLTCQFPIHDYYTALRQAPMDALPAAPAPGETFMALSRLDYVVRRYSLDQTQYLLLQALQEGTSLGEAIERVAAKLTDDAMTSLETNLHTWFQQWTADRFFSRIE